MPADHSYFYFVVSCLKTLFGVAPQAHKALSRVARVARLSMLQALYTSTPVSTAVFLNSAWWLANQQLFFFDLTDFDLLIGILRIVPVEV